MKNGILLLAFILSAGCLSAQNTDLKWTTGNGDWEADSLGNHRIAVDVSQKAEAVICEIPWRRKDFHPEEKEILIFSERTGEQVFNCIRKQITRESGTLIFEPVSGPGTYFLYHMPYRTSGSRNYPTVKYLSPQDKADPAWKKKYLTATELKKAYPREIQSINDFHSFYPMEVIATRDEVRKLLHKHPDKEFLLFPEDRLHPVKMWTDLPQRWVERELQTEFRADARRNESFAFQIAVYASSQTIEDMDLSFSDWVSANGQTISSNAIHCYNKAGTDWTGHPLNKTIRVEEGQVQPLWFTIMIPEDAEPGLYKGNVFVYPKGMKMQAVQVYLDVKDEVVADHGDNQPEHHSRLRWLDSEIAADNDIIAPYTPIRVKGNELNFLGRRLVLSSNGLPEQISGFFTEAMTGLSAKQTDLLFKEMMFQVSYPDGRQEYPVAKGIKFGIQEDGRVDWSAEARAGNLDILIQGSLEADGFLGYEIQVESKYDVSVKDISLLIPMNEEVSKYMLGLGRRGGQAPDEFSWKWDPYFNNDGAWIGTVNLGLQSSFRDENYERPLNTNFYHQKPLNMPPSWYNEGKGGIQLSRENSHFLVQAYSGARDLKKGEKLHFNVQFLITPFHALDNKSQWSTRYYHRYEPVDSILAYGGNTINVHHATEINPYINYPFMTPKIMKEYIDEAHSKNARVKIYYTVRELSNICPEIWALKSLGDEILSYGPGGGYSWLQEHLDGNYIGAWFVPEWKDAAVINSGVSRWHNYYLEGLNWLVNHEGIDGLYIDDVAFDRSIMKRVRKILKRGNPNALIDLHSANQFNPRDGFANSANLYMEHFAYLDRLWFGEYFDYNADPDYWLTEVSGIPFGIMGEMLQDGGNQWRGLLFGMTSRAPWSGDPAPIWKAWDDFGIEKSEMIGYWVSDCPVKTGRSDVPVTVYKADKKALLAVASWAAGPARVELQIDWESLGIDPEKAILTMPEIRDFQSAGSIQPGESFQIPDGKGFLIIIEEAQD